MSYFPAQVDYFGNIKTAQAEYQLDAFNRNKVANPFIVWACKQDLASQDYYFNTSTSTGGSVTYNSSRSSTSLDVTTSSGSLAIRQSRAYIPYQPGKATTVMATGVFGAGQANTVKRIGMFDDNNGVFFQLDGTTKSVVVRSNVSGSPSDTTINQSSWNIDPLDGSGPSGITLDYSKAQIFTIDFQWLGVGVIRFGFFINGITILCHQVNNANSITSVFMRTPNLPIRYEIRNTGAAAGTSSLEMICASVVSSGDFDQIGKPFTATTTTAGKSIGTTLAPIVSIRGKSTNPRPIFQMKNLSMINPGNRDMFVGLYINTSLTGSAFTSVNANSQFNFDITATAMTGGTLIWSNWLTSADDLTFDFAAHDFNLLASDFAGTTNDILTLAGQQVTGAANTVYGCLNWLEYV